MLIKHKIQGKDAPGAPGDGAVMVRIGAVAGSSSEVVNEQCGAFLRPPLKGECEGKVIRSQAVLVASASIGKAPAGSGDGAEQPREPLQEMKGHSWFGQRPIETLIP
jgi:hypothetical protein